MKLRASSSPTAATGYGSRGQTSRSVGSGKHDTANGLLVEGSAVHTTSLRTQTTPPLRGGSKQCMQATVQNERAAVTLLGVSLAVTAPLSTLTN